MSRRLELNTKDMNVNKCNLLCNNISCCYTVENVPAKAKKLCPFCKKIGYCSNMCFNMDILKHVLTTCDKKIKTPVFIEF